MILSQLFRVVAFALLVRAAFLCIEVDEQQQEQQKQKQQQQQCGSKALWSFFDYV